MWQLLQAVSFFFFLTVYFCLQSLWTFSATGGPSLCPAADWLAIRICRLQRRYKILDMNGQRKFGRHHSSPPQWTQLKLTEQTLCFCCWLQTDLTVLFIFLILKLATATPQNQWHRNHAYSSVTLLEPRNKMSQPYKRERAETHEVWMVWKSGSSSGCWCNYFRYTTVLLR